MKLSKILMSSVLAVSLVFGFASCAEEEDENGMISRSGDVFTISYENTSDKNSRGFVSFKTKHNSTNALISVEKATSGGNGDPVVGYIFGLEQDSVTKGYTFGIIGFSNRTQGGLSYYVDWCTDVAGATLSEGNDFKNTSGSDASQSIVATWTAINDVDVGTANHDYKIYVEMTNNEDGSYTLQLKKADKTTAIGSPIAVPNILTKKTEATQTDIAAYANVYARTSLKATITADGFVGEGVPVEYID